MSLPVLSKPVKLFCGLIYRREASFPEAPLKDLVARYGPICLQTVPIDFNYTSYYYPEMGQPLTRQWVAFEELFDPTLIAETKLFTNELESRYSSSDEKRLVNLDPGYLALSKIILVSCKNFAHRIYLKKGVWAQLEFQYRNDKWHPQEWTFPDYKDQPAQEFFYKLRELYRDQLKLY
ncbi:DUF4416 family protein [bacterium]|nr:DUF4416 family protein [bacterium]